MYYPRRVAALGLVLRATLYIYIVHYLTYDELRQGPGPDLGPRLNGYGYRTIVGTSHYGDRLISGPAIIETGQATREAVPQMIPPVPKREERSR